MKQITILLLIFISLNSAAQFNPSLAFKTKSYQSTPCKDTFVIPHPQYHVFTLGSGKAAMKRKINTDEWHFDSAFVIGIAKSLEKYGYKLTKVKNK
jgi:hypothetical protein